MEDSAHNEKHNPSDQEDLELDKLENDLALIETAMEKIDQGDLKAYETMEAEIIET
ncbi:MAG: hypothetical protein L7S61_07465 [Acidimicrobiales bacterium]|jgi:hypothetical protein|nr:hypothetical protein [Acidimicrobiales bacterium]